MQKKKIVLGLVLLAFFIALMVLAITLAIKWIGSLNPNLSGAIVTAIVGLVGLLYAQWHTRTREISESHRQSKIEVYNTFFDIVDKFQDEHKDAKFSDKNDIPDSLKKEFRKLNRGLIVWGSPGVIKAWLNFRHVAGKGSPNVLVAVDGMYRAIRKDLGNSNFGLQEGDLLKTMLSDPENLKT